MNSSDAIPTPPNRLSSETSAPITLRLFIPLPPSFKNSKRSILDRNTGRQRTLTPGKVKRRMDQLEDAIVSALFSWSQTKEGVMRLACWKQSPTALFGPSDDSIKEIPCGEWDVRYVEKSQEGLEITFTSLEAAEMYSKFYSEVQRENEASK